MSDPSGKDIRLHIPTPKVVFKNRKKKPKSHYFDYLFNYFKRLTPSPKLIGHIQIMFCPLRL